MEEIDEMFQKRRLEFKAFLSGLFFLILIILAMTFRLAGKIIGLPELSEIGKVLIYPLIVASLLRVYYCFKQRRIKQ